ncbi:MAG: CDP-diacylglycerol--serine O-phosphatidyltransferase [Bacteroidales bacterium]|nr:CDP-diacylglycerol--serine O-phosphatidyltransferase [Bacteroidales bacterium]
MGIAKHIPNTITLLNLLSGCMSILFFSQGEILLASYAIFLAAAFDFMDGLAARVLKAYSNIGRELDSLADVVSFGVAPAFILYYLILHSHGRQSVMIGQVDLVPLSAFILPLFAALRLAKFNVDDRQTENFLGLPTPAAGLLIASLPLIKDQLYESQSLTYMVFTNTYFYLGNIFLLSILMITELPLFGLKFKSYGLKGNEIRYIFLTSSLILLVFFQFLAIPYIVLIYLFLSLIVHLSDLTN